MSFKRLEDESGNISKESIIRLVTVRYQFYIRFLECSNLFYQTRGIMQLSKWEAEDLCNRVPADKEGNYKTDDFIKILCTN